MVGLSDMRKGNEVVSIDPPGRYNPLYQREHYRSESPRSARIGARVITQAYADFRLRIRAVPEVEEFFRSEIETLREELDEWGMRRAQFMNEESVVRIADDAPQPIPVQITEQAALRRTHAAGGGNRLTQGSQPRGPVLKLGGPQISPQAVDKKHPGGTNCADL